MERRTLGRTGIEVSTLCLGTMLLGRWGPLDRRGAVDLVHAALDGGITIFDCADVYSDGDSEEILGEALRGRRDDVVIVSKFFGPVDDHPLHRGASRRWIVQAIEGSLRRLGTDHLDVYLQHRPDPGVDLDETLGALSDLVHQGKVRAIGSSTFPAELIVEAQWVAERRNRERPRCEEPPYSILTRGVERDVLPVCQAHGMGVIPWGPLGGGWLTGAVRRGRPMPDFGTAPRDPLKYDLAVPENQRKLAVVEELAALAADNDLPLGHLALGFVLEHPAVTSAIVGPATPAELAEVLAGADVRLDEATLDRIDELVPPGVDVNHRDPSYAAPGLDRSARRRSASGRGSLSG
jgi:aryl-alcohol dehydrogenase-like predicted oxidoreductase